MSIVKLQSASQKKPGTLDFCLQLCQMPTDFQNILLLLHSVVNLPKNSLLNILPHLKHVATLPCEISVSAANCSVRLIHLESRRKLLLTLIFGDAEVINNLHTVA